MYSKGYFKHVGIVYSVEKKEGSEFTALDRDALVRYPDAVSIQRQHNTSAEQLKFGIVYFNGHICAVS